MTNDEHISLKCSVGERGEVKMRGRQENYKDIRMDCDIHWGRMQSGSSIDYLVNRDTRDIFVLFEANEFDRRRQQCSRGKSREEDTLAAG